VRHVRLHGCRRSPRSPYRPRHACHEPSERSPPPTNGARFTRWALLPAANRQRLLYLLGRLVERQLTQTTVSPSGGGEEGRHDAHSHGQ
jgi:hypothetical protein